MSTIENIWDSCRRVLLTELGPHQFESWIRPQPQPDIRDLGDRWEVVFRLASRFKLDWFRTHLNAAVGQSLAQELGKPVDLLFVLAGRERQGALSASLQAPNPLSPLLVKAPDPASSHGHASNPSNRTSNPINSGHQTASPGGLNPRQTFETLIVGKSNQLAHAAASQVANHPGEGYNPLFIYGGVGLGKTHLLHAIGNLALLQGKQRVQYIHAERFVSDVVRAYQRRNFEAFKQHYHSLDVLLIDDVQFFAGKEKTQEEFFYAFEALLSRSSQIILTSDTYPRALREMDQRLLSRFDAGLTVAVEPPEIEMRVAILKQIAAQSRVTLPEEVAFYVAKNVRSNVRELEGSLRKVLANASFSQKPITLEMARQSLRDFISSIHHTVSVENIQKTVAQFHRISVEELLSRQRPAHIALPRQIAMYLSKELTQKSLPDLGLLFAGRDHTTILHAHRKIAALRASSPDLNQQLHILEQRIKG